MRLHVLLLAVCVGVACGGPTRPVGTATPVASGTGGQKATATPQPTAAPALGPADAVLQTAMLRPRDAGPGFEFVTDTQPVDAPSEAIGCGAPIIALNNQQNAQDIVAYAYAALADPGSRRGVQSGAYRFPSPALAAADISAGLQLVRSCHRYLQSSPGTPTSAITLRTAPTLLGRDQVYVVQATPTHPAPTVYQTVAIRIVGATALQAALVAPAPDRPETLRLLSVLAKRVAALPR